MDHAGLKKLAGDAGAGRASKKGLSDITHKALVDKLKETEKTQGVPKKPESKSISAKEMMERLSGKKTEKAESAESKSSEAQKAKTEDAKPEDSESVSKVEYGLSEAKSKLIKERDELMGRLKKLRKIKESDETEESIKELFSVTKRLEQIKKVLPK